MDVQFPEHLCRYSPRVVRVHLVALPTTLAAATACAALTLARLQLGCLKLHQISIREATCENIDLYVRLSL